MNGVTLPSSTSFGVIEMKPSGRSGSEVSEYARQWRTPSTSKPTRTYCPGRWPDQRCPGRTSRVAALPASRAIRSTLPRSSRVDQSGLISSR